MVVDTKTGVPCGGTDHCNDRYNNTPATTDLQGKNVTNGEYCQQNLLSTNTSSSILRNRGTLKVMKIE